LACVLWVDVNHWYTRQFRFVFNKLAELVESPGMVLTTLRLFNRYPLTDALEIFKSNSTNGALSPLHQFLGNPVVYIPSKASFFLFEAVSST
jgi:hypothetical protein